MIEDEIREALKELVDEIGAVSARIIESDDIRTGVPARTLALGGGEYLRVELPTRVEKAIDGDAVVDTAVPRTASEPTRQSGGQRQGAEPGSSDIEQGRQRRAAESGQFAIVKQRQASQSDIEPAPPPDEERSSGQRRAREVDIEAAFDRVTRQLRAIRRRWEVSRLPEVTVAPGATAPGGLVIERIQSYMAALASIDRATNAFVIKGTQLVAAARPPGEMEATRWPFLARRALSTHAPNSSHGEVVDPDAYAMSFWYDAALVVLLDEPYAIDFVRHRCKQVSRELCNLLPMLDPDPEAPAAIGPRPRRPTQQ